MGDDIVRFKSVPRLPKIGQIGGGVRSRIETVTNERYAGDNRGRRAAGACKYSTAKGGCRNKRKRDTVFRATAVLYIPGFHFVECIIRPQHTRRCDVVSRGILRVWYFDTSTVAGSGLILSSQTRTRYGRLHKNFQLVNVSRWNYSPLPLRPWSRATRVWGFWYCISRRMTRKTEWPGARKSTSSSASILS